MALKDISFSNIAQHLVAERQDAVNEFVKKTPTGSLHTAGEFQDGFERFYTVMQGKKRPSSWYHYLLNIVPGVVKRPLGNLLSAFNELRYVKKLPGWVKGNFLFDAVFNTIGSLREAATGFQETQGNIIRKSIGGLSAGLKSFAKGTFSSLGSTWASIALPLLFGLSITGLGGAAVGIIGSMGAGFLIDQLLLKMLPGHKEAATPSQSESPDPEQQVANAVQGADGGSLQRFNQNPLLNGFPTAYQLVGNVGQLYQDTQNRALSSPNPFLK